MKKVVAKPEVGQGMESSMLHDPPGRDNCGVLNRQRRQASKHIIVEGGYAEVIVISSK